MVGGGGSLSATDAILRVIAPAGSTVTISKGAVSKSDQGHENASDTSLYDYYFIIHASQFDSVNPWTVTATLGSDTASATVIIDSADEYDVVLDYGYYLVKDGLLTSNAITTFASHNTVTQNTGYVEFTDASNNQVGIFSSTDAVDLTNYSTLVITITEGGSFAGNEKVPTICIGSTRPTTSGGSANITGIVASTKLLATSQSAWNITAGTYTLDVSGYTGSYYIAACSSGVTDKKFNLKITKFGLEA